MSAILDAAKDIENAYTTRTPIAPVRDRISSVADAYAVQMATVKSWLAQGRTIAGHKIGLTAKAVQAQLGVDQPDFGTIFSDMVLKDNADISLTSVMQPRVEAEVAFVLKNDLKGEKITPEAVIAATDYICPALEICGSRIAQWNIKIEDTVADNASAGLIVLGPQRHKAVLDELPKIAVTLHKNDAAAVSGIGAACLDNPAIAVAWLAEALTKYGNGLSAGDVVMSGALAPMVAADAGQVFIGDFGAFGSVTARFA